MVNYQQGKIYKICSLQTDKIYVGSTTKKTLAQRMAQHRYKYQKCKEGKGEKTMSYELLDKYDDCEIVLIENYPCNSKDELYSRERFYIEQNKDKCVNKCIPTRTKKEHYEDNKEEILRKNREYQEQNKDKMIEYRNNYYENNKDKKIRYQKEYYETNKGKTLCDCGAFVNKVGTRVHLKTKKHLDYINSKN